MIRARERKLVIDLELFQFEVLNCKDLLGQGQVVGY
jgi:hypothetical protein